MDQRTWEQISTSRAPLRERAGTYFLGIAIGCGMLGMLWMVRSQAAKSSARQVPAMAPAPSTSPPVPSNLPGKGP